MRKRTGADDDGDGVPDFQIHFKYQNLTLGTPQEDWVYDGDSAWQHVGAVANTDVDYTMHFGHGSQGFTDIHIGPGIHSVAQDDTTIQSQHDHSIAHVLALYNGDNTNIVPTEQESVVVNNASFVVDCDITIS